LQKVNAWAEDFTVEPHFTQQPDKEDTTAACSTVCSTQCIATGESLFFHENSQKRATDVHYFPEKIIKTE